MTRFAGRIIVISAMLATFGGGLPGSARADDEPRILPPSFPLEPNKKPEETVRPGTYVDGPKEPPKENEALVSRVSRPDGAWWDSFELGWFYASQTTQHDFQGGLGVHQVNASPLSLDGRLDLWPARLPISFVARASATSGNAESTPTGTTLQLTSFSDQDFRGAAGLRIHVFPREWRFDLALGADVEDAFTSYATLTPDLTAIDVDLRQVLTVIPALEMRFSPSPNWGAFLGMGYALPISSSGQGDATAQDYRRMQAELDFLRFLSAGNAIGLGASYMDERATWVGSNPVTFTDAEELQDLRLSLFWRKEF